MSDTAPARQSVEHVHRVIRESILDGSLEPGETMSQVALADELGVSRTPLREALRMLQGEGLILSEPNRRVRVAPLSLADVEELYAIRIPLEVTALRLSLPRMTPEDIADLEGSMAAMAHFAEADDYARWYVPHQAFHRGLTQRAGARFDALLQQLFDHAERYRRMHFGRRFSAQSTTDHREILNAVKGGDADRASALLGVHLARTVFGIIEVVDPDYEPAALDQVLADLSHTTGFTPAIDRKPSGKKKAAGRRKSAAA
ncbi:MAG TPA: GntR family transcriptional regulator [Baekduia sp.]|uniref:GntR family transcriptional regulator n=1 Tax=Baekduia sp. TaxID=2600305 RepID=UPI002D78F3E7|nr:GntR family transcriptional regulator [Baekduia sp.]HET6506099.1 GntR family transcriptional regulator [Baekduia sp.]